MPTTHNDLFDDLCIALGPRLTGRYPKEEAHIPCPQCQRYEQTQMKFSFSRKGGHCFVCGYNVSLGQLAVMAGIRRGTDGAEPRAVVRPQPLPQRADEQAPPWWLRQSSKFLYTYTHARNRVDAWQSYKPVTEFTIRKYELGVGGLPGYEQSKACTHERLIYPVYLKHKLVAFRGRSFLPECAGCPKWLSAYGSTVSLWGIDDVDIGDMVIIAENPVDAMLTMQVRPDIKAIASTGGAATWQSWFTEHLRLKYPSKVVVWYDNDLAGSPNDETRAILEAHRRKAWQERHPGDAPPKATQPNGPRIANVLRTAGVPAQLYAWPEGTPPKADIGWFIMEGMHDEGGA